KSVIIANQAALAAAGSPVVVNWIGADATAFHTFIYNPSKTVPQTIPINYFLPTELTTEDLSLTPAALTTTFNPDQNAVAVTGSPSLDPEAHSLYTIISTDIWDINPTELESFRFQANSLATSLERSSVYPQANTLRQNINTALDTILSLQQQTRTPEAKIQTYRQIQTLHQSVSQGIQELQNLANSNQSSNSLMGFIGGVQAVAVWGMIVIVIAGFIFLSLYMRALYQQTQVEINGEPEISLPLSGPILALPSPHQISASQTEWSRIHLPLSFNLNALTQRKFSFSLVIFSAVLLSTIVLKQQSSLPRNNQVIIAPLEPTVTPSPSPSPLPPPSPSPTPTASPSATILIVPPGIGASVDLRRLPTTNSSVITSITLEEIATIATQSGDWLQVTLTTREPVLTGWLNRNLALIISN
ncbi:MAG TPA: hypothetical protein VN226_07905, partial [Anaerolineales bacterium]|nr:hypothetical protein [Anaerolineales bacterium]